MIISRNEVGVRLKREELMTLGQNRHRKRERKEICQDKTRDLFPRMRRECRLSRAIIDLKWRNSDGRRSINMRS